MMRHIDVDSRWATEHPTRKRPHPQPRPRPPKPTMPALAIATIAVIVVVVAVVVGAIATTAPSSSSSSSSWLRGGFLRRVGFGYDAPPSSPTRSASSDDGGGAFDAVADDDDRVAPGGRRAASSTSTSLLERLSLAIAARESLAARHPGYDAKAGRDRRYYVDPPTAGGGVDDDDRDGIIATTTVGGGMTQYSHMSTGVRRRLLIGSYAAWQWQDRDELASPSDLKLEKVSRVNYAFFQTDADGYVYGTESWVDPNILFGPYNFGAPKWLPEGCRGGLGRDDGYDGEEVAGGAGGGGGRGNDTDFSRGRGRRGRRRKAQATPVSDDPDDDPAAAPGTTNATTTDATKCEYFEQCHRNFPNAKSCNVHRYKEGLTYRSHVVGTQVYPSIGGWSLSSTFPIVASSDRGRRRFADECVGLIDDYGFDGVCVVACVCVFHFVILGCIHGGGGGVLFAWGRFDDPRHARATSLSPPSLLSLSLSLSPSRVLNSSSSLSLSSCLCPPHTQESTSTGFIRDTKNTAARRTTGKTSANSSSRYERP